MTIRRDIKIAIVGASIGGLSAANVLRRLGFDVQVYELFAKGFQKRGGALGSVDINLLRRIVGSDKGAADRAIRGHGHFYGDLWEYLYQGLPNESVHFGIDVQTIADPDSDRPAIVIDGKATAFDVIIGADGGKSTLRPFVTQQQPVYSGYTVWRGLVPMQGIDGPPSGGRTVKGVRYETLGFPCAGPGGPLWNCGVYMAMPQTEVAAPTRNRQVGSAICDIPDWFVPFTRVLFGERNARFWADCIEHGKVTPHPIWEFASDPVVSDRIALLGDAAHLSSPRVGAGAYTAMLDAWAIGTAFNSASSVSEALALYNQDAVPRARALYDRSRRAGRGFAPDRRHSVSPVDVLDYLTRSSEPIDRAEAD
jgi:2-polyprenyl-6-methoxyphenol hydroxylase-like FAD-dependent oxidoreductase